MDQLRPLDPESLNHNHRAMQMYGRDCGSLLVVRTLQGKKQVLVAKHDALKIVWRLRPRGDDSETVVSSVCRRNGTDVESNHAEHRSMVVQPYNLPFED